MNSLSRAAASVAMVACAVFAADAGADLRTAARKGQTAQVKALLDRRVPIDSADKDGRTPLMLAAQHGRADTVKLLLDRGARADARDKEGWSAYALAVMEGRDETVRIFPPHPPIAAALNVTWAPDNLYTSCFLKPQQLAEQIALAAPDAMVAAAVREFASLNGKGLAQFVENAAEVTVTLKVRPNISCLTQQTLDNVSMAIDARIVRARDQAVLLEKTFGGGLKGLNAHTVSSPAQYAPLFSDWAKAHASGIYWATVEAWLRAR